MLIRNKLCEEHGQSLILIVMVITVIFVIGAVVVDVGLWLSERRGSQTDADFAALDGAWELLDPNGTSIDASNAAFENLGFNDEQGNILYPADGGDTSVTVDDSCWNNGEDHAVTVNVEHETRAFFVGIFGVGPAEPGAHAKACVGAANAPGGLLPFEINEDVSPCFENGQPVFTQLCWIAGGAFDPNTRGILDLQADGDYCSDNPDSGDVEELIINGASGICLISETGTCDPVRSGPWYDCVVGQTGNPDNSQIISGVNIRVSEDGDCDAAWGSDLDTVDDFDEALEEVVADLYEPRDCDPSTEVLDISPRVVTIVVLATNPGSSNEGAPILAFAGVFLAGCVDDRLPDPTLDDLDPYCVLQGPTPTPAPSATPGPAAGCTDSGHCAVYGQLVNIIVTNGDIGPPTDQTTLFGIALVE